MSKIERQRDVLRIPPEERLEIADALSSSLDPEPLSDWQEKMLDERIAKADAHPERFSAWKDVKARIEKKILAASGVTRPSNPGR